VVPEPEPELAGPELAGPEPAAPAEQVWAAGALA